MNMSIDFHENEIFMVECGDEIGTAFLISENLMITAFHVVIEAEEYEKEIILSNEKYQGLIG